MKAEPNKPASTPSRTSAFGRLKQRIKHHPSVRQFVMRRIWLKRRFKGTLLGVKLSRPEIGLLGEILAAKHLRKHGRRVLFHNYRGLHRGEVDIVARHGQVLSFVEVKTRTSTAFGRPADAVTKDKQQLIQRGALDWLRLLGNPRIPIRFDIAEVILIPGEKPEIHVIEDAFSLPDSSMAGR
jgi:Holliday junction resolvase-like predicted endonuclease